ncbi:Ig-like domain-containing protein [Leifsonia sp. LS-T14]|uniref:Ig-like domain-containing protein n=1 Tax=unclassified Leifsonia TaxID=2663824 RepID=UPI0035A6877A
MPSRTGHRTFRRRSRAIVCAALALALAPAFLALDAPAAQATFASQCASPTRILDPGPAAITVAPGETVLLAGGSFTGGVNALPSGATLCVAPGASLTPPYMNNATGSLVIAAGGSTAMPFIAVGSGFDLQVEGDATFAGLNINGSATVQVAPGGTFTVSGSFSPGTGDIRNQGSMHVAGAMNLNSAVQLINEGTLVVDAAETVNGSLTNTGTMSVAGSLTVNGPGTFQNGCAVQVSGDLSNGGQGSVNEGVVIVDGLFTNNGGWSQSTSGTMAAARLSDDGRVTGFGQYRFTGATSMQGSFVGDSASAPIVVDTTAPAGQFFDIQTGTVGNLVRGVVSSPILATYPAPECSLVRPSADLQISKTGPATVLAGGSVTYAIQAANLGPGTADAVTVVDTLPAGFTPTSVSAGGVIGATTVSWDLGSLGPGALVPLSITGTVNAATGATLLNVVAGTSRTPDPDPGNNDGSSEAARTSTIVEPSPPPNQPPTASDQTLQGTTGRILLGRAVATDPDADQTLTFTTITSPQNGTIVMLPGGGFAYRGQSAFTGVDTVKFQACDNGVPVECAQATLTFEIFPVASDDLAETFRDQPVQIPLVPGDSTPGAILSPTPVTPPDHGTVVLDPITGVATYTPANGFVGTDRFVFAVCSPTAPQLCDSATVTITVLRPNSPPVIDDALLRTTTGTAVQGALAITDPEGDAVTLVTGVPPRSGTATVDASGTTTYTPLPGFAGRDFYTVIGCSAGQPDLCTQATVTVEVVPVALDDAVETPAGQAVTITALANDRGTVLDPTIAVAAGHGSVRLQGRDFVYTPGPAFAGIDRFTYEICAAAGADLCARAVVTITVLAPVPPTPGPTAPPDTSGQGSGSDLPATGSDEAGPTAWALLLIAGGGILVGTGRTIRRRRAH